MKKRVIFMGLLAGLAGIGEVMAACPGTTQLQSTGGVTLETNRVTFSSTSLALGASVTVGGLTFTATTSRTRAQVVAAFANLANGATSGAGTSGTYSGQLVGWSSGASGGNPTSRVDFTSVNAGNVTNISVASTTNAPSVTVNASYTNGSLSNLLTGRTVCVGSTGNWGGQEFHQTGGTLIDFKQGAGHAVDPTTTVGTWSVTGTGTNTSVGYGYTGGGSFTYKVYDNGNGTYSFCNGSTETVASKIVTGQVGC